MIAAQNASKLDRKRLSKTFVTLDTDHDGRLSRDELISGWNDVFGEAISVEEIDQIIESVDTDKSGFIEFDEFIVAALNQNKLYSKSNLAEAFREFD
jgi:calcium-dependent protein kinase